MELMRLTMSEIHRSVYTIPKDLCFKSLFSSIVLSIWCLL